MDIEVGSLVALDPVVLKILTHSDWGYVRVSRCSPSSKVTSNFSPTPHLRGHHGLGYLQSTGENYLVSLLLMKVLSAISPKVAHLSVHSKVLFP